MYTLMVLEAESLKSRCQQGLAPSGALGGDFFCLFQLPEAAGVVLLMAVGL